LEVKLSNSSGEFLMNHPEILHLTVIG